MDKTKRYLSVAFVAVLAIVIVVSLIGMILLKKKPVILQGQIEATEIRISGKLPGRIDTFLVKRDRMYAKAIPWSSSIVRRRWLNINR